MIKWTSEKRKIIELIPAKYNPRTADDKEWNDLNDSIEQFNLADPIIINKDNTVIGGHFRLKVLQSRGETEVDVRVPDRQLTPEEERRLNLRLNKNNGSWDLDMLANFDEDMLKEVGFTASELDEIFQLDEAEKDKADACGAVPGQTDIKAGDMFQLGRHRLICGDATNPQDIAALTMASTPRSSSTASRSRSKARPRARFPARSGRPISGGMTSPPGPKITPP